MKYHVIPIGICTALLVTGCSDSTGPRISRLQDALDRSQVSLGQSVATGQASVEGGKAIKAALLVDSEPEYLVNALGGGVMHDVRVNIVSGAVVSKQDRGASNDPCPGSIPIAEAIAIAEARAGGSAVKIQPDDDDHCLREVQVLAGNKLWEVKLSREGQVLEVEEADGDGD
jgi:hypothetical protein